MPFTAKSDTLQFGKGHEQGFLAGSVELDIDFVVVVLAIDTQDIPFSEDTVPYAVAREQASGAVGREFRRIAFRLAGVERYEFAGALERCRGFGVLLGIQQG